MNFLLFVGLLLLLDAGLLETQARLRIRRAAMDSVLFSDETKEDSSTEKDSNVASNSNESKDDSSEMNKNIETALSSDESGTNSTGQSSNESKETSVVVKGNFAVLDNTAMKDIPSKSNQNLTELTSDEIKSQEDSTNILKNATTQTSDEDESLEDSFEIVKNVTDQVQDEEHHRFLSETKLKTLKEVCPSLKDASDDSVKLFRVDQETRNCLKIGSECGKGMAFYIQRIGSLYGFCDCRKNPNRAFVYDIKAKSCGLIYSQGGCDKTQHLRVNTDGLSECAENPCHSNGEDFIQLNGICSKIGDIPSPSCKPGEQIVFVDDGYTPTCVPLKPYLYTFTQVEEVRSCQPGNRFSILQKKCMRTFKSLNIQLGR